jgi:hypothetical protein
MLEGTSSVYIAPDPLSADTFNNSGAYDATLKESPDPTIVAAFGGLVQQSRSEICEKYAPKSEFIDSLAKELLQGLKAYTSDLSDSASYKKFLTTTYASIAARRVYETSSAEYCAEAAKEPSNATTSLSELKDKRVKALADYIEVRNVQYAAENEFHISEEFERTGACAGSGALNSWMEFIENTIEGKVETGAGKQE